MLRYLRRAHQLAMKLRESRMLGDCGVAAITYAAALLLGQVTDAVTITPRLALILAAGVGALSAATGLVPEHSKNAD